jgi:ASPIC and UnbV/FG-GAP-like repeat
MGAARRIVRFSLAVAIVSMQLLLPRFAVGRILLFEDLTIASGINLNGETHSVVWGDYNNDGCPDLWVSKHSGVSGGDGQAANLYQNLCDGHFREVTKEIVGDLSGGLDFHGAAWADFDNDGDVDLVQLRGGEKGVGVSPDLRARLFVNSGGKLVDRAAEFGVDYPLARGRMPLWLDYDNDGKLDLFFGADHRPDGQSPPTIFHQGDHAFDDARCATGFNLETSRYALISDLNGDRRVELIAISGERAAAAGGAIKAAGEPERDLKMFETSRLPFANVTPQFLSDINVDGEFSEIAIADFNDDLRPDIYITGKPTTWPNQLLINTGSRFALHKAGNAVVSGDFDNDGDQDLYIDQADQAANGPNTLLENRGDGTFAALSDAGGPTDTVRGRGGSMAVADYDNDGFLDIAVTNGEFSSDGWVQLLHNVGNENHWLKVKLIGNPSNRDAIGATVIVTTSGISQLREVNAGIHRFAQDDTTIHFGVAGARVIDEVIVRWPSGRDSILNNVATDQVLRISE